MRRSRRADAFARSGTRRRRDEPAGRGTRSAPRSSLELVGVVPVQKDRCRTLVVSGGHSDLPPVERVVVPFGTRGASEPAADPVRMVPPPRIAVKTSFTPRRTAGCLRDNLKLALSESSKHLLRQRAKCLHRHHFLLRLHHDGDRGHAGWLFYGHALGTVRTWFRRNERGAENG